MAHSLVNCLLGLLRLPVKETPFSDPGSCVSWSLLSVVDSLLLLLEKLPACVLLCGGTGEQACGRGVGGLLVGPLAKGKGFHLSGDKSELCSTKGRTL